MFQTFYKLRMKICVFILPSTFLILLSIGKYACSIPPHIIFMLIDDLGWNDVSFHGSLQIPTPNIDTLAFNGIILNNYYVQPLCTPSRGSLLTGKYPIRLGLQHYVIVSGQPWGLSPKEILLPQHLKRLGYATHGIGKWHLGSFRKDYVPTNRGFDSFFGFYQPGKDYFTHWYSSRGMNGFDFYDNDAIAWNYTGHYSTELFTNRAKEVISSHNSSKPLFLFISHQAVHSGNSDSPLQAPKEYIDKFTHIKDKNRKTFAAMTYALDKSVGKIFTALREKGMLENSIIIFSTDNGGSVEGLDGSTGSNWPLRGSKHNMWEGGIRGIAFIWSQLLPKARRSISKNLMHISDWLPTLYAAAGGNPAELGEIDGHNFWPFFKENQPSSRDHILHNIDSEWNLESIRKNQYKLLKGSVFNGSYDGWFDKEGKRKEGAPFNATELAMQNKVYKILLHESEVYQFLMKQNESNNFHFNYLSNIKKPEYCDHARKDFENCNEINNINEYNKQTQCMKDIFYPVQVQCGTKPTNASTNCLPTKNYCLFDIEKDPCEYNNLASILPDVTEELKKLMDKYRRQAVPIRNKPVDPSSNPKYHGNAWISWKN